MSDELLRGVARFADGYFRQHEERYAHLVDEGQAPHTLFIACSDSRVLPGRITDTGPGELFVVRNVGNLVPPPGAGHGEHGVAAAVEYAVEILEVGRIVVCGHSHCGAVRALYEPPPETTPGLRRWLRHAEEAKLDEEPSEEVLRRTERRSVALQVERLRRIPAVASRIGSDALSLDGWHYLVEEGEVRVLDAGSGRFVSPT